MALEPFRRALASSDSITEYIINTAYTFFKIYKNQILL